MFVVGLLFLRFWSVRTAVGLCVLACGVLLSVSVGLPFDLCSLSLSLSLSEYLECVTSTPSDTLRGLPWSVCAPY